MESKKNDGDALAMEIIDKCSEYDKKVVLHVMEGLFATMIVSGAKPEKRLALLDLVTGNIRSFIEQINAMDAQEAKKNTRLS